MPGSLTRTAIAAQPEWLRRVGTEQRLPAGPVLFTGCGTSFHAAQTGGEALQSLDVVDGAGTLVALSHEGETWATAEAVRRWSGPKWAVTAAPESTIARLCDEVVVAAPELERSWCHTASYTSAVATLAALRGEDVSWLPDAVERALDDPFDVSDHERWLVAGAGATWPTAQEAVLKLREGVHVAAEAHHTEQLLHGHLAAVDESVRAFVFDGPRADAAVAALREVGCETTLVAAEHPVVDIVPFQLLTVDLADARGIDPDVIRRDEERWARARAAYR